MTLEIHFATVLCDWKACRQLIEEIGSPAVKINLDSANMIRYEHYWSSTDYLREGIESLGEMIETCHAKDVVMHDALHLHMDECPAGEGCLDYADIIASSRFSFATGYLHGLSNTHRSTSCPQPWHTLEIQRPRQVWRLSSSRPLRADRTSSFRSTIETLTSRCNAIY